MPKRYWLLKSEPTTYSFDDLQSERNKTTLWDGVRNYQARNLLRDQIAKGDQVLFYHSACKEPAAVGIAKVVKAGYPDPTQFDKKHKYYDEKSKPEKPRWYVVDVQFDRAFKTPVTLKAMREMDELDGMVLLQKGSRLSVQPVSAEHWKVITKRGGRA